MAVFAYKKTQAEKQGDLEKFIDRYELAGLDDEDVEDLIEIFKMKKFSFAQDLIEQNFVIIKLLNRMNKNIEDLKNN